MNKKYTVTERVARICATNPELGTMDVCQIYFNLYGELPKYSTVKRKITKYRKEARERAESAQSLRSYGNEGISHWEFVIIAIISILVAAIVIASWK